MSAEDAMGDRYDVRNIGSHNAIGRKATSIHVGDDAAISQVDVLNRLSVLRDVLTAHSADVGDIEGAAQALALAEQEAREGRFDLLKPLVGRVAAAAPGVAAVTSAVVDVVNLLH